MECDHLAFVRGGHRPFRELPKFKHNLALHSRLLDSSAILRNYKPVAEPTIMKRIAYYEAFDHFGNWIGTATLVAIRKAGLIADLSHPMYERENLALDGWACRAKR
jgi:hypothetical protein